MHEKNNCEMLGYKKRSELAEKSKVFVKLTDADLRWLIPLAERTKKNATPLPHKSFTIKDMDGRWETLIYVQEIQPGKIRVDGYAPIDCKNGKKNAVVNIYEAPYFSITFHFVLGVAECDSFFGRTVTKEKLSRLLFTCKITTRTQRKMKKKFVFAIGRRHARWFKQHTL